MATNNQVNVGLSGSSGTGNFVGATAPTVSSIAFNPTTQGIVGTTAADNASAGYVGQVISSSFATLVSTTSNTPLDVTSITLTAGDWDVRAFYGTTPAASTVQSNVLGWISTSSATLPSPSSIDTSGVVQLPFSAVASTPVQFNIGPVRINVSGSTTVYLSANVVFTTSTLTSKGIIWAERVR